MRSRKGTIMKWLWYGVLVVIMGTPGVSGYPLVRVGTAARPSPAWRCGVARRRPRTPDACLRG